MTSTHYRDALSDQPLDFELIERERLYDGFRPLDRVTIRHPSLDGEAEIGPMRREFLTTGSVAIILPYDPALDSLVVIRQFRLGNALKSANAAALEFPAGLIDEGESVEAGAARELEEETGLTALAIERCYTVFASPGLTDEHAIIFLAIVDASALGSSAGKADEHEDIRPIVAKVDALIEAVDEGRVENGFIVGCTHWFARKGRARAAALAGTLDTEDQDN